MNDQSTSVRVAFGLGSNLGDRLAYLQSAVDTITADPGITVVAVSPVVATDPVGGPEQPDYLNAVLVVDSTLPPTELLALAQLAELQADRQRTERWGPRTLDVDVLAVGDYLSDDPQLTVPHPRALQRAFVLVPWAAVDPQFEIQRSHQPSTTVADALTALTSADKAGVRPTELVLQTGTG